MSRVVAIVFGLAAGGCALNGILEVEMTLPYDGVDDRAFAIVQVDDEMPDLWNQDWDGPPTQAFQIDGTGADPCADVDRDCNVRFSVDSQNTSLERLFVKVTFCDQADCQTPGRDGNPPLYAFVIERPFYQGCVTTWYANRPPVPVPALAAQPEPPVADFRVPGSGCTCRSGSCTMTDPAGWDCPPGEPPVTQIIERCEVGRFGDEGDATAGWCVTMGQHFCEVR